MDLEVLGAKIEFYEKNGGYRLNFHRKRRLARRVMACFGIAFFDCIISCVVLRINPNYGGTEIRVRWPESLFRSLFRGNPDRIRPNFGEICLRLLVASVSPDGFCQHPRWFRKCQYFMGRSDSRHRPGEQEKKNRRNNVKSMFS